MKKYIDKVTVPEYRTLVRLLKKLEPIERAEMQETGEKRDYIELRFLIIKMQEIIKKYEKKA